MLLLMDFFIKKCDIIFYKHFLTILDFINKWEDMETPLINKPRRWLLGIKNLAPQSIEEQNLDPSEMKSLIFNKSSLRILESYFSEIDQRYYYGFSYKLIKVITDSLELYKTGYSKQEKEQFLTKTEGAKKDNH
jgi:hypothetical protein